MVHYFMRHYFIVLLGICFLGLACQTANFSDWRVETFDETPITQSQTKTLAFRNDSGGAVQKLVGIGFDGSGDGRQNFRIDKISVGDKQVAQNDIIVPPGSSLNLQIVYEPKNLETTKANFGGWVTGEETRFVPYKPGENPKMPERPKAIHRAVLLAVYETPQSGMTQIELVGKAVAGPNGETSLPEEGGGACVPGGGTLCFAGNFSMDIPKLFTQGPMEDKLASPIRFTLQGSSASLNMGDVPPLLIVLKGNGPGEPLEGQPVSAASIIIKGVSGQIAQGTFDGGRIELTDLSFRIQVVVGEITQEEIAGINPIVDFTLDKLTLTTEEPLTDGNITLKVDTTLVQKPSGNPIFDEFLGGAKVILRLKGKLAF